MSELAQRLRKLGGPPISGSQTGLAIEYGNRNLYMEAAAELDRLTAEVASLQAQIAAMKEAARPFVELVAGALEYGTRLAAQEPTAQEQK